MVPCEATVYVQLVESDLADRWNGLKDINVTTSDGGAATVIRPPPECESTSSACSLSLHDVQMSQMKPDWFNALTKPIPVFK